MRDDDYPGDYVEQCFCFRVLWKKFSPFVCVWAHKCVFRVMVCLIVCNAIYAYNPLEYQLPLQQNWEYQQEQENVWKQLSPKNPLPLPTAGCQCFLETVQATMLCIIKEEDT